MRISDWSSDVCSSDLRAALDFAHHEDEAERFGKFVDGVFEQPADLRTRRRRGRVLAAEAVGERDHARILLRRGLERGDVDARAPPAPAAVPPLEHAARQPGRQERLAAYV